MSQLLSIIIVTHNSEAFLSSCIDGVDSQTVGAEQVIIVDSGSQNTSYLEHYREKKGYEIHLRDNIGFAAGNNFGLSCVVKEPQYILFINPDTFLEPGTVESAINSIADRDDVAIVTGRLTGYDLKSERPTGLLDSTGIFRTWYGRWYDRAQGQADGDNFNCQEQVPAICGAFMLCRAEALQKDLPELFDESFFLYKEDIDLCLRLRNQGWKLLYSPIVKAFHARGWSKIRREIPYQNKCLASRNEIKLTLKHRSPYIVWALFKYLLVRLLRV